MWKNWGMVLQCAVVGAAFAVLLLSVPERDAVPADGDAAVTVPGEKYIALTFDDGPRADTTARLLDGLGRRGVHATFFVIGEQITGNEALLRRMVQEGHQVGSHTFTHRKLQGSRREEVLWELHKTEALLQETLGEGPFWLRPPYGLIDDAGRALVKTPMVYWSIDPEDWKVLDAERVTEHVCSRAQSGDIVLLHDIYPTSVEAALQIVDRLQAEGFRFVTVEELLAQAGTEALPGHFYVSGTRER